jgi:hypothetical protein
VPPPPPDRLLELAFVVDDRPDDLTAARVRFALRDYSRYPPRSPAAGAIEGAVHWPFPRVVWETPARPVDLTRLEDDGALEREFIEGVGKHRALWSRNERKVPALRFVIETRAPAVWSLPWERALSSWVQVLFSWGLAVPSWSLAGTWRSPVVLRRWPEEAGMYSGRPQLEMPLTIAFASLGESGSSENGDELIDPFVRSFRGPVIEWGAFGDIGQTAHVVHVRYTSASDLEAFLSDAKTRGYSQAHPLAGRRLVVLQDVAGNGPLTMDRARRALAARTDAMLLSSTVDPEFFRTFYRGILHNKPLDLCLAEALERRPSDEKTPPWLGVRQGGEYGLLLTGTLAGACGRLLMKAAADFPRLRQRDRFLGVDDDETTVETDSSRLARSLKDQLQQASHTVTALAERIGDIAFGSEDEGVRRVVEAHARIRQAEDTVAAARDLLVNPLRRADAGRPRYANLWLTKTAEATAERVPAEEPLCVGAEYGCHLGVGERDAKASAASPLLEDALREAFAFAERLTLDVVFFSPREDFEISARVGRLELPRVGASAPISMSLIPRRAGLCRLRVGFYYANALLQSLWLETRVVDDGAALRSSDASAPAHWGEGAASGWKSDLDWAVSADFLLLDQVPQPVISIFTNRGADTHWVGIRKLGPDGAAGGLATPSTRDLEKLGGVLRESLQNTGGPQTGYRFTPGKLVSLQDAGLAVDLVKLASEGKFAHHSLIELASDDTGEPPPALPIAVEHIRRSSVAPEIVTVALCSGDEPSVPWAALYDLPLARNRPGDLRVCERFRSKAAAKDPSVQTPGACSADPKCPLNDGIDVIETTVCPFGFWGLRYQIEQPTYRRAKALDLPAATPGTPELDAVAESAVTHKASEPVTISMCVWPHFGAAPVDHRIELEGMGPPAVSVSYADARPVIEKRLVEGGVHVHYFYCHGEVIGGEFRLRVGPSESADYILATNLAPSRFRWRDPAPLVFLNACESIALPAEVINKFLIAARAVGARGVIGTEIPVRGSLARNAGKAILSGMLRGASAGEAILRMRRELFAGMNPLGLAYTLYAPSTLHFHLAEPGACDWCRAQGPRLTTDHNQGTTKRGDT